MVAGLPAELAAQPGGGRGGRGGRGGAAGDSNAPAANAQPPAAGGRGANPLGEACADYFTPEQYAYQNGALAVVAISNFQQLAGAGAGFGGRGPNLNGPNFQVAKFQQPGACPGVPAFTAGPELTNLLFTGEKLTGAQVFYGGGTNAKLDSFELGSRKKLSIHLAVHATPGHGENVVGILEGSDPALKNEYVVMSAHLDHLGLSAPGPDGHSVNPGADDDGSGSTGLLGVAHAYAEGAARGIRPCSSCRA